MREHFESAAQRVAGCGGAVHFPHHLFFRGGIHAIHQNVFAVAKSPNALERNIIAVKGDPTDGEGVACDLHPGFLPEGFGP